MTEPSSKIDGRLETSRFGQITFEDYGRRALDPTLSPNEKIGFPDVFRDAFSEIILADICSKLPRLIERGSKVLDIGCGCGPLTEATIKHCNDLDQLLVLNDHENMLAQLMIAGGVSCVSGRFPSVANNIKAIRPEGFDAIICYSVLHMIAVEQNPFSFVDEAMALLAPGGAMIIGDIPNFSKLRRFLSSDKGIAHHKSYMRTEEPPNVKAFDYDSNRLDDGFILGLVTHFRMAGLDAYLVPQDRRLPMSTRREDLIVMRP